MNIGLSIKNGCQIQGKTQKQLSESVGVYPSTITAYVKNKYDPTVASIEKMAEFFGVKVSIFISWGEKE